MNKYERAIGLKTIYLAIARRLLMIIIIFVPIVIASFVVTNFILTKTYISSVTLSRGWTISSGQYSVMKSYIQNESDDKDKPGALYTTFQNLQENGVKHSNGNIITMSEIKSGLVFTAPASDSVFLTFSFQSTDSTITQKVLQELAEISVQYLKARGGSEYASLSVNAPASAPKKNSEESKYFLIALVAGAVLALGVPFIYEIVADEVYDREDIEYLGCSGFELDASKRKEV